MQAAWGYCCTWGHRCLGNHIKATPVKLLPGRGFYSMVLTRWKSLLCSKADPHCCPHVAGPCCWSPVHCQDEVSKGALILLSQLLALAIVQQGHSSTWLHQDVSRVAICLQHSTAQHSSSISSWHAACLCRRTAAVVLLIILDSTYLACTYSCHHLDAAPCGGYPLRRFWHHPRCCCCCYCCPWLLLNQPIITAAAPVPGSLGVWCPPRL